MIRFENVSKSYDKGVTFAVKNFSLEVKHHSTTVLGLKDEKSWSEPDFSALWCGKVWFKVVGGQL